MEEMEIIPHTLGKCLQQARNSPLENEVSWWRSVLETVGSDRQMSSSLAIVTEPRVTHSKYLPLSDIFLCISSFIYFISSISVIHKLHRVSNLVSFTMISAGLRKISGMLEMMVEPGKKWMNEQQWHLARKRKKLGGRGFTFQDSSD